MVTSKVVDSYDVVQAVKHFASQRTADPKELQKEASSRWPMANQPTRP